ncbi:MAG: hypothetical protein JW967_09080 [Dehalococcoidales bacterium]|nr:hypothetical protein [Dehalococcoidales bacterium]
MSRSDLPPTNKKAIQCEDCGKWVTLQGYGGHRRFYHGEYQRNLKQQLLNRLVMLRTANKITKSQFDAMTATVQPESTAKMTEIMAVKNFVDSIK